MGTKAVGVGWGKQALGALAEAGEPRLAREAGEPQLARGTALGNEARLERNAATVRRRALDLQPGAAWANWGWGGWPGTGVNQEFSRKTTHVRTR